MGRTKRSTEESAGSITSEISEPKKRRTRRAKENPEVGDGASPAVLEETRTEKKLRRRTRKSTEDTPSATSTAEQPVQIKRRGRAPAERDSRGDIIPAGSAECCICGAVSKQRSASLQRVDIRFNIGTRGINLSNKWMCMECVKQLPNLLAGALHFAFNIPKDQFLRGFLYPPFELEMHDQHKQIK